MSDSVIRPIAGPNVTFGSVSDLDKARQEGNVASAGIPGAPEGDNKPTAQPTVANLQAQFLTRRPNVIPFGSTTPIAPAHPNFLKDPITTGFEHLTTDELWRSLVAGAKSDQAVYKHFAFTPPNVTNLILQALDIQKGDHVLEPSAGTGCLALPLALASDHVDAIEKFPKLQELLKRGAMRYDMTKLDAGLLERLRTEQPKVKLLPQHNFLQTPEPAETDKYDKIVLSPPHGGAELDHVQHAYKFLKPGGTMVAILPNYALNMQTKFLTSTTLAYEDSKGDIRTGNQYKQFIDWFDAHKELGLTTCIKKNGTTGSPGKSDFGEYFTMYDSGPSGEVIESQTEKPLRVVLMKITKPVGCEIPLNLDPSIPNPKATEATANADGEGAGSAGDSSNVVPIRTEHKLAVNA